MANTCHTCRHPEREKIERDIAGLVPLRTIADRYGDLSHQALIRHKADHLPKPIGAALVREEQHAAADLIAIIRRNAGRLERMVERLDEHGRDATARSQLIQGCLALNRTAELLAHMRGDVIDQPQTVINTGPQILVVKYGDGADWRERAIETKAEMVDQEPNGNGGGKHE